MRSKLFFHITTPWGSHHVFTPISGAQTMYLPLSLCRVAVELPAGAWQHPLQHHRPRVWLGHSTTYYSAPSSHSLAPSIIGKISSIHNLELHLIDGYFTWQAPPPSVPGATSRPLSVIMETIRMVNANPGMGFEYYLTRLNNANLQIGHLGGATSNCDGTVLLECDTSTSEHLPAQPLNFQYNVRSYHILQY